MPGSASMTASGSTDLALAAALTHIWKPITCASIGSLVTRFGFLVKVFHFLMNSALAGRLDRLEVVPGGEMADQRLGIDAGELFLADRERHDRDVLGADAQVAELLVERHVGVAVDGRHHRGLAALRAERLDGGDARLPIGVAERRVVDRDVARGRRPSTSDRLRECGWWCADRRSRCLRAPSGRPSRPSSGSRRRGSPAGSARRRCRTRCARSPRPRTGRDRTGYC